MFRQMVLFNRILKQEIDSMKKSVHLNWIQQKKFNKIHQTSEILCRVFDLVPISLIFRNKKNSQNFSFDYPFEFAQQIFQRKISTE